MPKVKDPLTMMPKRRSMLTLLALCSGLTAIRFALQDKWRCRSSQFAIAIACVFDVLDGRVARLLNIASKFGAGVG